MVFSHHHETCSISYQDMILDSGHQAQFQHAYTDKCSNYDQAYHILSPHSSCHLPHTKSLKLQALMETMDQLHLKLDIPADLQVGAYGAVVYTTKIILALARVSKQQSQPFMVRVEINIAASRAGGQVNSHRATHLWVQVSANEHQCLQVSEVSVCYFLISLIHTSVVYSFQFVIAA